jgi:hypothetical protein
MENGYRKLKGQRARQVKALRRRERRSEAVRKQGKGTAGKYKRK